LLHGGFADPTTIDDVLYKGRVTANEIAERTLQVHDVYTHAVL